MCCVSLMVWPCDVQARRAVGPSLIKFSMKLLGRKKVEEKKSLCWPCDPGRPTLTPLHLFEFHHCSQLLLGRRQRDSVPCLRCRSLLLPRDDSNTHGIRRARCNVQFSRSLLERTPMRCREVGRKCFATGKWSRDFVCLVARRTTFFSIKLT